jgi:pyruvate/2-oxoglutarate dehydrogenase complex dihydrolipoamide dehydrogenase (E3) component
VILLAGAKVNRFHKEGTLKKACAEVRGEMHDLVAEEILVATGREARTAGLGLPAAGVATERGRVRINDFLQTSRPHIYAAGDVCGPLFCRGRQGGGPAMGGCPPRHERVSGLNCRILSRH